MRFGQALTRRSVVWYHLVCLSLSLTTLALTIWAAQVLWSFPYDGMTWSSRTGQVTSVDPHGPATDVGVERGDLLVALDGMPLSQAYVVYPTKHMGDIIHFGLQRGSEQWATSLLLTVAPAQVWLERLEPLAVGGIFWLVGVIAWGLRPLHKVTCLFFLMSQTAVGVLAAGSLSTTLLPAAIRLFNLLLLFLAPLALHFCASFPVPLAPRIRHWVLGLAYGFNGLLATIYLWISRPPANPSGPSCLWTARYTVVAATLFVALALLLRSQRKGGLTTQRRRRLLIAGMVTSLFPLLLLSFVPALLRLTIWMDYVWTFPFLVLLPISFVYAIQHGELGRIDLFLNRSLVYALLTLLLISLSILLSRSLGVFVPPTSWARIAMNAAVVLALAALMNVLRAVLQRWVDRLFYGGWYDYRSIVRRMSQELSSTLDLEHLVQGLLTTARTMRFGAATLLWPENGELVPRSSFGYTPEQLEWLRLEAKGMSLSPLPQAEPAAKQRLILPKPNPATPEELPPKVADVQCWLPLISRENLRGVLVLGQRQGGDNPDAQDLDLLSTVAAQAAVAAENVALLETLREQLAELRLAQSEVAEVRRRLSEGREAERQYLARELHDGPVQDLEGVRLWLGTLHQTADSGADPATAEMLLDRLLQVIDGLRAICRDLRPAALAPFGLAAALRSDIERFREAHPESEVQLDLAPDGHMLLEEVRLALYRIYREAMSNIERHAQAKRVLVRLCLDDQHVLLEIHDNGQGFTVPNRWVFLARQGHLGLLGAAERAETIGGRLEVISTPGQGAIVRVEAPLRGRNEDAVC